jgi:hypothetical protein
MMHHQRSEYHMRSCNYYQLVLPVLLIHYLSSIEHNINVLNMYLVFIGLGFRKTYTVCRELFADFFIRSFCCRVKVHN